MLDYQKLQNHRQQTEREIDEAIEKYNEFVVNRPCGYGKTYQIMQQCKKRNGKKLIIEPTRALIDHIKFNYKDYLTSDINICTYTSLIDKTQEEFIDEYNHIDYIFCDEAHRLGAEKWGSGFNILRKAFPYAKVIGLSATPIRTDGDCVIDSIFCGNQIFPLYFADAILQDLLPNPCYVASLYAIDESMYEQLNIVKTSRYIPEIDKPLIVEEIQSKFLEYKSMYNIPNILQKYTLLYAKYRKNMKFIIFVKNTEDIEEVKKLAFEWFKGAFSHMNKVINIYSVNYKQGRVNNQEITEAFERKRADNVIDIMVSVNMFNEGIHLDNISGVILLRRTYSDIVYCQQIGRAINTSGDIPIIFDFVNNYRYLDDGYINLIRQAAMKQDNVMTKRGDITTISGDIINIHDDGRDLLDAARNLTKKYEYYEILSNNKEKIKNILISGGKCNQVSLELGIPFSSCSHFIKKTFPELWNGDTRKEERQNKIEYIKSHLWKLPKELAQDLECSESNIFTILKEENIILEAYSEEMEELKKYGFGAKMCMLIKRNEKFIIESYNFDIKMYDIAKSLSISFAAATKIINCLIEIGKITPRQVQRGNIHKKEYILSNKEKIIESFKNGYSITQICKEYNCGHRFIKDIILSELSIEEYNSISKSYSRTCHNEASTKKVFSRDEISLILKLKEQKKSNAFIAKTMGVRRQIIRSFLNEIGYKNGIGVEIYDEFLNIIIRLFNEGKSIQEISDITDINFMRIEILLSQQGLVDKQ